MIYRYRIVPLLIALLLLLAGCQIGPAPLAQQQLQDFVRDNKIQPLAVEEIGGNMTVILYKNTTKMGCYLAFARNGIEALQLTSELRALGGDTISPVSFTYKAYLGQYVLCMTINDKDIQTKAYTVRVIFPNKKEVVAQVKNGGNMILSQTTDMDGSGLSMVIYDVNQNEIIRSPFW